MDFVLVLHSHLPFVLHHGRWPHGSDWLCEAALDTYLPLYEQLCRLDHDRVPVPITIGFTPILANQLAHPDFGVEMEAYVEQRLVACHEARSMMNAAGDGELAHLVSYWEARLVRLRDLFQSVDRDLVRAFRALEHRGLIEILSSAATHGYLPLLARDESIRLQLGLGRMEHKRLFGTTPRGCWLPECAYRPRGWWSTPYDARRGRIRAGIEEHLAAAGYRYFITDAHLAHAGTPLGSYDDVPLGAERFDGERHDGGQTTAFPVVRKPYRAYRVNRPGAHQPVAALVRDPRSSMQVWSRHQGYPGDEWYLEFHKIRWPHGLRLWRVTGPEVDLGAKQPYNPDRARQQAGEHAGHFLGLLQQVAADEADSGNLIAVPFDTELFGHWWFEGVDFLGSLYTRLAAQKTLRPVTGSGHLGNHPPRTGVQLARGSWGAHGDESMWMNPDTLWTWRRLWPLEDRFWDVAPEAIASERAQVVLAQAAREMLLAQASDWQFIISTGVVRDYGERRLQLHCDAAEQLLETITPGTMDLDRGERLAAELHARDDPFPNVLAAVAAALDSRLVASR